MHPSTFWYYFTAASGAALQAGEGLLHLQQRASWITPTVCRENYSKGGVTKQCRARRTAQEINPLLRSFRKHRTKPWHIEREVFPCVPCVCTQSQRPICGMWLNMKRCGVRLAQKCLCFCLQTYRSKNHEVETHADEANIPYNRQIS